jgi:hypothetical protein
LKIRGLIVIATFLALASACGSRVDSGGQEKGPSVVVAERSTSEVTTKIVGATPEQHEILLEALAGIGETKIEVIEVVPAEKGWSDDPDAVGLEFSTEKGLDMYSEWQSWLVGHVLAARSAELQLPEVAYVGDARSGASGVGSAPASGQGPPSEADPSRIAGELETAAKRVGASVDEIRILRPRGIAVSITLRVSDPAEFLDKRFWKFDPFGDLVGPAERDHHVRVVDSQGQRIVEIAGALLGEGSSGAGWVRPDLIGCYDPAISRPMDWKPPPCPTSEHSQTEADEPPPAVSARIVGATPKQEALVRDILAGMEPTLIDEVRIAPAHSPWTPYKPNSVIVSVHYADSPEKERGGWEATLLAQAFATRSRLTGLQPVAGYESGADGAALDGPEEPEPDARRPIDQAELTEALSDAARSSGAEVLEVRIVKPMNLAAALTLRVEKPAFYLKHRLEGFLRSQPSGVRVDGLYIRIVDQEDRFVWFSASTDGEAIGSSTAGARKDLRGCDPTPRFGSPGDPEPPPCPVD